MNLDAFTKEKLWLIMVDTVKSSVMYPTHKSYTRDTVLQENPDITVEELAMRLNMTLGEAMVILDELRPENKNSA
jgi:hypothetical protein